MSSEGNNGNGINGKKSSSKRKINKSLVVAKSDKSERPCRLHFRRCHLCSGVSENEEIPVEKCQHCGKPMAPFYFFNDLEVIPVSEAEIRLDQPLKSGQRVPVRGFTAFW